jgi:miniconductance mechanosensitive channel
MTMLVTMAINRTLSAVNLIYSRREDAKRRPIKGIIQSVQVSIIVAAVILAFLVITKKPINGLMAGFGALLAVLMLVFRDPLMGLVSGFQISSKNMVRIRDWIEVPVRLQTIRTHGPKLLTTDPLNQPVPRAAFS